MNTAIKRVFELDFWRGLAVIGMVAFHVAFALKMYGFISIDFYSGFWHWLGWIVRVSFILLVGISMAYSYSNYEKKFEKFAYQAFLKKQVKRSLQIMTLASFFVTLPSILLFQDLYVRFGVLHFIAVAIFFVMFFVKNNAILFLISFMALPISSFLSQFELGQWGMILGARIPNHVGTLDLFQFFPWVGLVSFGVLFGKLLLKYYQPIMKKSNFVCFIGKQALTIYILHLVVIFAVIAFMSLIIQ